MHATGSVHSFDLKSFIDFDIGRFLSMLIYQRLTSKTGGVYISEVTVGVPDARARHLTLR